jgi:low affinity Fe/Cu permease
MRAGFSAFSRRLAELSGHAGTFFLAVAAVVAWAVAGPLFHYSDTWQLVINTSTTILTFLMVFLIQNTQNRDTAAMQLKLDELIRATGGAHNTLLDLERLSDIELKRILDRYAALAAEARRRAGALDTGSPDVEAEIPGIRADAPARK